MDMSCAVQTNDSPRFKLEENEKIYALFDAFIKKTLVEDRAIDFSAPAILNEDGTIEFYESDYRFSDLIRGVGHNNTKACFEQLIAKRVTKEYKLLVTSEPLVENYYCCPLISTGCGAWVFLFAKLLAVNMARHFLSMKVGLITLMITM
jgi:hypothetical protein